MMWLLRVDLRVNYCEIAEPLPPIEIKCYFDILKKYKW